MNNWLGLLICVIYIFGLIGLAEGLRRRQNYSSDFTRKMIHIGVGMMCWVLHLLFDTPWFFIAACIAFMVLNFLDWRYGFVAAMASGDRSNLGTVYFPFVAGLVAYLLWDSPPLMVAAMMPLTWGDGMAPVIGRKYGRFTYTVHQSTRTLEGSLAFFGFAFLFTWLALFIIQGEPNLTAATAVLPALTIALITAVVEAVSQWGLDNLTITAVAIAILQWWPL